MTKQQKSLGLGLKFVLLILLVFTITLSINTYIKINIEAQQYTSRLIEKGKLLAKVTALIAPEAIFAFDFSAMNDNVKDISAQEDVIYCAIKNQEGEFLTSYFDMNKPEIKRIVQSNPDIKLANVIEHLKNNKNIITLNSPIEFENENLGSVVIGISKYKFKETIKSTLIRELSINFIMLLFLSGMIFY
ncbi:MAG TPA: hypothetical protein ENJ28_02750, partial [Gammaproteobacteria bacterium]|nr:hypothetical protein [Gammaproteobacteria bacterium]